MVTRTEAYTYLLRGIAVSLCLFFAPLAGAEEYRQYPSDNALSSENRTYTGRRTSRRHIPERKRKTSSHKKVYSRERKTTSRYHHSASEKKYRKPARTISRKPAQTRQRSPRRTLRYRIRRGDTLYSLARRYKTTVTRIRKANNLTSRSRIKQGQILKIPTGTGRASKTRGVVHKKKPTKRKKVTPKNRPAFRWPMVRVTGYNRDNSQGVRPIGLLIKSRANAPVRSSASGTVRHIGYMRGYGNFIVIQHQGRYMTVYANLERISVSRGRRIRRGEAIGHIGRDRTLHFQIDYAGKPKNPLKYLPRRS